MADGNDLRAIEPPNNLEAEAAVLGAILFDNSALDRVREHLRAEDFYAPAHRAIYERMNALIGEGRVADGVTLRDDFERDDQLKAIGGASYLADCMSAAAFGPAISEYAGVIADFARRRALIEAGRGLISAAHLYSAGETLSEHDAALELERSRLLGTDRGSDDVSLRTLRALENTEARKASCLALGFPSIDQRTNGVERGKLTFIGARPGIGKTAFLICVARHINQQGYLTGCCQLEMSVEDMGYRYGSYAAWQSGARVANYSNISHGAATPQDDAAIGEALRGDASRLFRVNDAERQTTADIDMQMRAWTREADRKGLELGAVFVDHVGLVEPMGRWNSAYERVSQVSTELRALSKRYPKTALIALVQLNRSTAKERRAPGAADLRDSGRLEEDANAIYLLHREDYYLELESRDTTASEDQRRSAELKLVKCQGQVDVVIPKCRHGRTGTEMLKHTIAKNVIRDPLWQHRESFQ